MSADYRTLAVSDKEIPNISELLSDKTREDFYCNITNINLLKIKDKFLYFIYSLRNSPFLVEELNKKYFEVGSKALIHSDCGCTVDLFILKEESEYGEKIKTIDETAYYAMINSYYSEKDREPLYHIISEILDQDPNFDKDDILKISSIYVSWNRKDYEGVEEILYDE